MTVEEHQITGGMGSAVAEYLASVYPTAIEFIGIKNLYGQSGSPNELIEKYENTKRGLYSGTVGYINPDGDFDFNVVIRSILYNQANKYLSFMVGGAITNKSDAENEYEECLLKAKAMFEVLK